MHDHEPTTHCQHQRSRSLSSPAWLRARSLSNSPRRPPTNWPTTSGPRRTESENATGEPANSYVVLRTALHTVIDLDDFDDENYRPRHVGFADEHADGADDDGKIEIVVRNAATCIDASTTDLPTAPGSC